MPAGQETDHKHPTFQESAKKFKPGPVAPPERDEDRPDMSGGAPIAKQNPPQERPAAAMHHPARSAQGAAEMPEGAPGQLQKMPGEEKD